MNRVVSSYTTPRLRRFVQQNPQAFFIRVCDVKRFSRQRVGKKHVSTLKASIKRNKFDICYESELPSLHVFCCSNEEPILEEGNHRLEAFYQLGYVWIPVHVRVEMYGNHESEDRIVLPPGLDERNENMRPTQWRRNIKDVLKHICGVDVFYKTIK